MRDVTPNPGGAPSSAGKERGNPVSAPHTTFKEFELLPPLEPREIVGLWRGRGIPTGHPLDGVLENLGWFGKRFNADMRADALLFWSGKRRLIALDPGIVPLRLALRFHKVGRTRIARNLFSHLSTRTSRERSRCLLENDAV